MNLWNCSRCGLANSILINSYVRENQEPGKAPLQGLLLGYSTGLLIALVVAVVYNFALIFIPIPYFNVVFTGVFGIILGYVAKIAAKVGLIRSQSQRVFLALIIGLAGVYFEWIAYLLYLFKEFDSYFSVDNFFNVIIQPQVLFNAVVFLNEIGSWSIFGATVNGGLLWIIWIIEAAAIITIPILIIRKHPVGPFSEMQEKWYQKFTLKHQFEYIVLANALKKSINETGIKAIDALEQGGPYRHALISIYYLPNEQVQYLCLDNINHPVSGGGKKLTANVFHSLKIDSKMAESLMSRYGTKKENFCES